MTAAAHGLVAANVRVASGRWRPLRRWLPVLAGLVLALYVGSSWLSLAIPEPSGPHAVGRQRFVWVDESRPESHTLDPDDARSVPIQVWYPARPGSGSPADYVDGLEQIEAGLLASGELGRLEVLGLGLVRDPALDGADVASDRSPFPLLLLSPGNATNVAFYASLAEDLASKGYVVIGVDHPFQVSAVQVPGGEVAVYDRSVESSLQSVGPEIEERVADIGFVLDMVQAKSSDLDFLLPSLDLDKVGILGHSNGGIAAVETCRHDARLAACLNIDGQAGGGPFGYDLTSTVPEQPFMFLTKEAALHEELHRRFEEAGEGTVRVVIPEADHGDFTDGALFEPSPNPFGGSARSVAVTTRSAVSAFFDHWLRGTAGDSFRDLDAPSNLYVNVYPLGDRPPIPGS